MSNAPKVGDRNVKARTTTYTEQATTVAEITKIDSETPVGWFVWGYPVRKSSRARQTSYPRLYFISKEN